MLVESISVDVLRVYFFGYGCFFSHRLRVWIHAGHDFGKFYYR